MSKAAIVSFSGGQDSTTCLFWALKNFDRVETVGFNYDQTPLSETNGILSFFHPHNNPIS